MKQQDEGFQELRRLLESQRFAVLSTRAQSGHPYASLVSFWVSKDLDRLAFCTQRATRKFSNLEAEQRVALLVDDRSNEEIDLQEASAATILGRSSEVLGERRDEIVDVFLAKHPGMTDFVNSPSCAMMEVIVVKYLLVTRFQNVIEFHLSPEVG